MWSLTRRRIRRGSASRQGRAQENAPAEANGVESPETAEKGDYARQNGGFRGLIHGDQFFTGQDRDVDGDSPAISASRVTGKRSSHSRVAPRTNLWAESGIKRQTRGVCVSPDGNRAATAGHRRTLGVWDLRSGRALPPLLGHTDQVLCVAWSPDGKYLLSGSADKTVRLWDAETGTERHKFSGHTDQITCVAFSPDGRSAARLIES